MNAEKLDHSKMAIALKELRSKIHLTQKDVADAISMPRQRYNRLEVGDVRPTLDQLYRLNKFYRSQNVKCDWNYLFELLPVDDSKYKREKKISELKEEIKTLHETIREKEQIIADKAEIIALLKKEKTPA